jgi:hypothetical protein
LRLGASIHEGAVLPSLLLTKLQAFPRQNALARALQEHGRLVNGGRPSKPERGNGLMGASSGL